jgi:hypothetical protein
VNLGAVNIDDKVLVSGRNDLSIATVSRVTKTRVTVMVANLLGQEFPRHFNRRTGSEIGSGPWSMVFVKPFDQQEWDDHQTTMRRKRRIKFLRDFDFTKLTDDKLAAICAALDTP